MQQIVKCLHHLQQRLTSTWHVSFSFDKMFLYWIRSFSRKVSNLFECDRSNTRNNVPLLTMSLGKSSLTKTVYTHYISNICTSTVDANLNRNINGIANITILGGTLFFIKTHNLITVFVKYFLDLNNNCFQMWHRISNAMKLFQTIIINMSQRCNLSLK